MENGSEIWAKEALPVEVRAPKGFLLGLKYTLKSWGFANVTVDENFKYLKVGHDEVVSVLCVAGKLEYKGEVSWGQWKDFIESAEVADGMKKANELMSRAEGGKGAKGKGKSSAH